jgi:hypothetical protein
VAYFSIAEIARQDDRRLLIQLVDVESTEDILDATPGFSRHPVVHPHRIALPGDRNLTIWPIPTKTLCSTY